MSDTYTLAEVADMLRVTPRALQKRIKAGKDVGFDFIRIGNAIRVPRRPLDERLGKKNEEAS